MRAANLNIGMTGIWQSLGPKKRSDLTKATLTFLELPGIRYSYRNIIMHKAKNRLPHMLIIESANSCNLRCVMCAYPEIQKARLKTIMPMELFQKIINDASAFGIKMISLSGMGEPLIDSSIFEKIKYAKNRDLFVEFFTNGTLLNSEKAEKILSSNLDHVVFSFDGADKETYEAIRVGAHWEQVIGNIQRFLEMRDSKRSNISVDILYLIQKRNFANVNHITKRLEVLFKGANIKSSFASNWRPEEQVIEELDLFSKKKQGIMYPCQRIYAPMIQSDGTVIPCCMDVTGKMKLGNIRTSSIKDIWDSDSFKKMRVLHLEGKANNIQICSSCYETRQSGLRWLL